MKLICNICPHNCNLGEGQVGLCRARANIKGIIESLNYGKITSIALDPIEKKPLYHFYPRRLILSIGSFGCNMKCPFCQNYRIATRDIDTAIYREISPQEIVDKSLKYVDRGNIGLAYTYNEPLIGFEFVYDTAKLIRENNLKNVVVTNGFIEDSKLKEIGPLIDGFNIDLKAFNNDFYEKIGGDLEEVKSSIKIASKTSHVEITTLIIPNENDNPKEIEDLAKFISGINKDIPLHISRFFPNYKWMDKRPTDVKDIYKLVDICREYLNYVYPGNC